MQEFLTFFNGIEGNAFTLVFMTIFVCALALFHSVFFHMIAEDKLKPAWLLFVIYPAIGVGLFFIRPGLIVAWALFLFASLVVGFLLSFLFQIIKGIYDFLKKHKEKPLYKRILMLLVGGVCLCLFFATGPLFIFIIILVVLIFSLITGEKNRFLKLQAVLPTSKIRSMAMGLVEIEGEAELIDEPFVTPIKSKKCIGYHYTVESIKRDNDGDKSYTTIQDERKCRNFMLKDETGQVEVSSENLQFILFSVDEQYSTSSRRYTQYVLYEANKILLIGAASLQESKPIVVREEVKNVFGMMPVSAIDKWNRFKPLRSALFMYLAAFGLLVALIVVLSIHEVDGLLVISLPENLFSWNFIFDN